jgi:2-phospho-L-lactate/phosphoenolpyruvate guanylyltransferase
MTASTKSAWVVVVPVKRAVIAKSRLTGVTDDQRVELARAFPADCVTAALACDEVRAVVAVTDDEVATEQLRALGAVVIPDEPDAGLNPALRHAQAFARSAYDDPAVAVLSGDLPALRPAELGTALQRARRVDRAYLADAAGYGTTLLSATRGADLQPRFGGGSSAAHRSTGAQRLAAQGLDSVRRDVDTADDLRAAVRLGVGAHTAAVLGRHRLSMAPRH